MFILEPFVLDALLAVGALLPADLGALVPADVEVLAGEEGDYLVEDVLDELEGRLLTRAEDVLLYTPDVAHLVDTAVGEAGQLGVRGDGAHRMAWELDLGNDGDEAVRGILDDLLDLLLSIVATILLTIALDTLGADTGQARVLLDLDAPALILREVPVQTVDLEHAQEVDVLLHVLDGEEVTADVDQGTAVLEAGLVLDGDRRDAPACRLHEARGLDLGREELQ